jgi:sec-independent protein translocase protein TatC
MSTTTMTFWQHVYELRKRVFVVMVCVTVCSIGGYVVFPWFLAIIAQILKEQLYVTLITEGFVMRIRIAFLIGAFLTIPVLIFEVAAFILPALSGKERRFLLLLLVSTFLLFLFGVGFAFRTVLPVSISWLKSDVFFPQNLHRLLSYQEFISFFFRFLLGFGLVFEFPVVIVFLLKLRIISVKQLTRFFRYFLIVAVTAAAVLSPGPDIASQIMLAVPMIALYLVCILLGKILGLGA